MIVVPGITGTTVPMSPIAISTMAVSHQKTVIKELRLSRSYCRLSAVVNSSTIAEMLVAKSFDHTPAVSILTFTVFHGTSYRHKSSRFHFADENRRWAEASHFEREFRQTKYLAALFSDGIHRNVHYGNVRCEC